MTKFEKYLDSVIEESLNESSGYFYIIGMKKGKKRYINTKGKWDSEGCVLKQFKNKAAVKTFINDNYLNQDGFDEILIQHKG